MDADVLDVVANIKCTKNTKALFHLKVFANTMFYIAYVWGKVCLTLDLTYGHETKEILD